MTTLYNFLRRDLLRCERVFACIPRRAFHRPKPFPGWCKNAWGYGRRAPTIPDGAHPGPAGVSFMFSFKRRSQVGIEGDQPSKMRLTVYEFCGGPKGRPVFRPFCDCVARQTESLPPGVPGGASTLLCATGMLQACPRGLPGVPLARTNKQTRRLGPARWNPTIRSPAPPPRRGCPHFPAASSAAAGLPFPNPVREATDS